MAIWYHLNTPFATTPMFGTVKFSNIYHPNTKVVNHVTCMIVVWELTCKLKVISFDTPEFTSIFQKSITLWVHWSDAILAKTLPAKISKAQAIPSPRFQPNRDTSRRVSWRFSRCRPLTPFPRAPSVHRWLGANRGAGRLDVAWDLWASRICDFVCTWSDIYIYTWSLCWKNGREWCLVDQRQHPNLSV